jgi:hypothetical protein
MKMWGSGGIAPPFLTLRLDESEWFSFMTQLLYSQGKRPRHPPYKRLGGPQSQSRIQKHVHTCERTFRLENWTWKQHRWYKLLGLCVKRQTLHLQQGSLLVWLWKSQNSIPCVYITKVLLCCYIKTQLRTNKNSIYAFTFTTATTHEIMLFKTYIYMSTAPAVGILTRKPSFPSFPLCQMG